MTAQQNTAAPFRKVTFTPTYGLSNDELVKIVALYQEKNKRLQDEIRTIRVELEP